MYTTTIRYFFVTCHRGHCGIGHSTEIKFAIAAANLLEAMDKAKRMPSVKHTRMIISGAECTKAEYDEYRQHSAYERYNQNYYGTRR